MEPLEIVVAPFEVWAAPVGEAFPDVDEDPAGNWTKIGTNGNKNMDPAGVTVQHPQTVDMIRVYGATAPVKAVRSSEDLIVSFTLWDLKAAEYARVLNDNTVTATAAGATTAGYDSVNFYRGLTVSDMAYLIRGANASPSFETGNVQLELPRAVMSSSPSVAFAKNAPAGLQMELTAIFDPDQTSGEELGRLIVQTADPTG